MRPLSHTISSIWNCRKRQQISMHPSKPRVEQKPGQNGWIFFHRFLRLCYHGSKSPLSFVYQFFIVTMLVQLSCTTAVRFNNVFRHGNIQGSNNANSFCVHAAKLDTYFFSTTKTGLRILSFRVNRLEFLVFSKTIQFVLRPCEIPQSDFYWWLKTFFCIALLTLDKSSAEHHSPITIRLFLAFRTDPVSLD